MWCFAGPFPFGDPKAPPGYKTSAIFKLKNYTIMKLNKKDRIVLNNILEDLQKAQRYISKDEILLCRKNGMNYGDSFINKDNESISVINKQIGNDLCYFYNAIERLRCAMVPEDVLSLFTELT